MINEKDNGQEFLDFIQIEESDVDSFLPIAGSYAVIKVNGDFLLCFNKWRNQWELPAGKREKNETISDCAFRELLEETGQMPDELKFSGLMKVRKEDGSVKYNPVFFGEMEILHPFQENEETTKIILWDKSCLEEPIDKVDHHLLKYLAHIWKVKMF
ncbi:NUDIX domain-containing protein [Rossellomorea vietnamensis]|uniref:NUDIX domain-containing protein n=1 Tax=Rossellomorea vietnamensis TaxID=218284 RepID=A0A5D4NYT0_9BACI|nr:NUDIX domain-containing protein [Rossellomorea vietnamensis]TYS18624.1 NUDIX domain-containing protein [Rossellomorea vietnamensis]